MESKAIIWLKRIELAGLYILAVSLPNFETPKAIGTALFFIGALGWRLAVKPLRFRRPDFFEMLLIGMWTVALVSTLVNWPILTKGIKGLLEATRLLLIGWLFYRSRYTDAQIRWLFIFLIGGTLIGLAIAFWEVEYIDNIYLEFHSLGGVNRSAIYLALMLALILGILLDKASLFSRRFRISISVCAMGMLSCFPIMGSRGAMLGLAAAVTAIFLLLVRRPRTWLYAGGGLIFAAAVAASLMTFYQRPAVVERTRNLFSGLPLPNWKGELKPESLTDSDRCRYEIAMVAWAQIRQGGKLLLGLGPSNYGAIRVEDLHLREPLVAYPEMWQISHAHNNFLTKICEEGLLGLAVFLLFLGYTSIRLLRNRPLPENVHWAWPAALGALLIALVAGLFNSVMVNEMGWLAMMMIGSAMHRLNSEAVEKTVNF